MEYMYILVYTSEKLDIFCKLLTGINCFQKYKNVGFYCQNLEDDFCETTQFGDCLNSDHLYDSNHVDGVLIWFTNRKKRRTAVETR